MQLDDILLKNAPLKNLHAGKRCFIVGNGPSIKSQDLTLLKDEVTIVVSSFFRHPDAKLIDPAYWVIADPGFWMRPEETFYPALQFAQDKCVSPKLFFPSGAFPFLCQTNPGPLIDLHFYHYDETRSIEAPLDFSTGILPFGQNVVIVSLMLAFHLGCNPIYFVGCDHDFMRVTEAEYENQRVEHFYPESKKCVDYLTWNQWRGAMAMMDYQYQQLNNYARIWGFNVFNATAGGCLDHYPRVNYESLFLSDTPSAPACDPREPFRLIQAAQALMKAEDYKTALDLLDQAMARNLNRLERVEGLYYHKAICLTSLGRVHEALIWARQDLLCNPGNEANAQPLIRRLEGFLS
ncbi:MAG: hypothetical protein ACD_55C00005G0002 [uncultured bacterium]|uniref:6-hydroxymethylpterin diphosphokinase MptE-like domain-containing protein n=1 Tax=Citrifermentans bemidjiense (strain ATCC BAA-1014 / DSM 16622 / JCM 12645 / Bem) TaxID=404380 RepID=B5EDV1_CITBB|nr:6-hydroxymethylpterin diphosphokinase MptE-like protein [Citrifermentans bemidjiense]ACH40729.1 protein of unknown function DUF115 [Citrifermentans bemidjiense Bem]EKD59443.1 MAG: hypothetical protein ACD_55C00005G0002 [uncultured bacterium]